MINFRIDKETPDYITMDRCDLMCLYASNHILSSNLKTIELSLEIYQEISKMIYSICQFEITKEVREHYRFISEFKIRKESALGKYLIENNGRNEIVDYTEYISYKDICNAMLITIFNDDAKMSSKIIPLFQKQRFGTKEDLLKEFPRDEEVLNYILENNDFDSYLARRNHEEEPIQEEKPFVVYEDGEWSIKNLDEDYQRTLKNNEVYHEEN